MQSSIDLQKMHARYEDLPMKVRHAIDLAFDAVTRELKSELSDFTPACDDRAEELIAAITFFYLRSTTDAAGLDLQYSAEGRRTLASRR